MTPPGTSPDHSPSRPITPADVSTAHGRRHPLSLDAVRLVGGPLGAWQDLNATATIPHCIAQLEESGVLDNFRRLTGESDAEYRGFLFADSDLYKVLEAIGWEIARSGTGAFDDWLDEVIGLVARVQDDAGYVMTWIQGVHPDDRFAGLEWNHEMYIAGHLIQAAIALDRGAGRTDLLDIARAFADLLVRTFGDEGREGVCGHPEIETALIELYRHTRHQPYLALANRMIDLRGGGLLDGGHFGPRYFQDHLPVRNATDAVGHAVRQLYLNAGVTDLYLETGEQALADAMIAQWDSAHERKMYLSGAFGSRHRDEAFGADYELPSDRAYAETCATIADLHWGWRMTLAFGDSRYGDVAEREIHNALRASVNGDGTRFFYSNPLQLRPDRTSESSAPTQRTPWYSCACCPPNIARVVAQLAAYVASVSDETLWIHLYAPATIDLPAALGRGTVRIHTDYPASGQVRIELDGEARPGAELALRVPSWSRVAMFDGEQVAAGPDGYLRVPLSSGLLELDVRPRWTEAHPRVDAVRGCLAVERGPVVYCVEQVDMPDGVAVDDLVLDPSTAPRVVAPAAGDDAIPALEVSAAHRPAGAGLYRDSAVGGAADNSAIAQLPRDGEPTKLSVRAVPFGSWGNREPGAMRVWLPAER